MNIMILGSGGREHALAWKITQSDKTTNLYIAPGNGGTSELGKNVPIDINNFNEVGQHCIAKAIDLLIIGPEEPLVKGIKDHFGSSQDLQHILIIGPDAMAAQLEGSKSFSKKFMAKYNIPTAAYQSFSISELQAAHQFLETLNPPYVLKADGLAAGKGVLILDDITEAHHELEKMLNGKFGEASKEVVIEEYLDGIEFSVFVLTDGKDYKILPVAKDYKRIGEGDTGLNTGGMGAVSPVSFVDDTLMQKVEEKILKPTIRGIRAEGMDYRGFIFFGLTNVKGEPFVIEYNVRMGDPETEVVMPRIGSDLVELLQATAKGNLSEQNLWEKKDFAATVMVVSEGYPGKYEKGKEITGLQNVEESTVFHAGTKREGDKLLTNGGRVIAFTGMGNSKEDALEKSYAAIKKICYEGICFRKDIGFDL